MSLKTRHIYEFENYRFDVSEKSLNRDGEPISLTPKVLETLQILVENAGDLVKKDELMQAVWRDRFVDESNLTFNIKMLRKALADDARQPRFIETIPRRGYRFIAEATEIFREVEIDGDRPLRDAQPAPEISTERPLVSESTFLQKNRALVGLMIVLVISSVVTGFWFLAAADPSIQSFAPILAAPNKSESLSYSGDIFHPRISPDGKYLAYVSKDQGNQTIWLRELASGTHFPLLPPLTDEYMSLMFSSKSDFVYFVRKPYAASQAQAAIYRISIFGGIPTKLITDLQGWFSLSPIDDRIAFMRYDEENRSLLMIADMDGKGEHILTMRNTPYSFRAMRWSPDGEAIATAVGQSENAANEFSLVEINANTGKEREITPNKFGYISDLEWLPKRSGLLFAAHQNNQPNNQIWQVSLNDGKAVKVVDDGTNYVSVSLNKEASLMAVSQSFPDFQLTVSNFSEPNNSIMRAASPGFVSFTTDGRITYTAAKGNLDIWIMGTDGSEPRQLTNDAMIDANPLVTLDGKHVFFTSNRSGSHHIWRMNTDGSDQVQITRNEGGYPIYVSPDGRFLFYLSALKQNLWKVSTDGGDESLFLDRPVISPAFSPDGKYLAYFYRADVRSHELAVARIDRLTEPSFFKQKHEAAIPVQVVWANDTSSVLYASSNQSTTTVWRQSLSARAPEKIINIGGNDHVNDFSISPGGDKFAYVSGTWKRHAKLYKGLR